MSGAKIDHGGRASSETFAIAPADDVYCAEVIEVADLRSFLSTHINDFRRGNHAIDSFVEPFRLA
jgi:hypothetical protein